MCVRKHSLDSIDSLHRTMLFILDVESTGWRYSWICWDHKMTTKLSGFKSSKTSMFGKKLNSEYKALSVPTLRQRNPLHTSYPTSWWPSLLLSSLTPTFSIFSYFTVSYETSAGISFSSIRATLAIRQGDLIILIILDKQHKIMWRICSKHC
jgi:hypothetical protein